MSTNKVSYEGSGRFIVFEGLDGAGTTTQVRILRDWLASSGVRAEIANEPSNGPIGAALRQAIEGRVRLNDTSLALAFAADRADHLFNNYNGILSKLRNGHWVLCDRYVLSGLSYQANDEVKLDWLKDINGFCIKPDMTFFIDVPPETCLARIASRGSHLELFHDAERLHEVRRTYSTSLSLKEFTGTVMMIDGRASVEAVSQQIKDRFLEWQAHEAETEVLGSGVRT